MAAALSRNLLTADGRLLSLDVGGKRLRVGDLATTPANLTVTDSLEVVGDAAAVPPDAADIDGGPVRLVGVGDGCVGLVARNLPLAPDGRGVLAPAAAPAPFILVSASALATLRDLAGRCWLVQGRGSVATPGSLGWRGGFVAMLGPQAIDVRLSGATLARSNADEVFVLDPDARVERLRRFEPLVAYAALGTDGSLYRCLEISLHSLARVARYTGRVLILTDRALHDVEPLVPGELRSRTVYHRVATGDRLHAALACYSLPGLAIARHARPLLVVDTDVVFDAPIDRLLAEILVRERPCVCSIDDRRPPADAPSSTGVIGVADAARIADLFHAVRVMADAAGRSPATRQSPNWHKGFVDDILRRLVDHDDELVSRHETRWNGRGPDPAARRGFAVFAGPDDIAGAKLPRMTAYLSDLLAPPSPVASARVVAQVW